MPAISYDPSRFAPDPQTGVVDPQSGPSQKTPDAATDPGAYAKHQMDLNQQTAQQGLQQGGMQVQNLAQQFYTNAAQQFANAQHARMTSGGGGGGGGGGWTGGPLTASGQASWGGFTSDLLKSLGVPDTPANQSAIMTWFKGEQPPGSPNATWNPLNIQNSDFANRGYTQSRPGQWNFPSEQVGLQAIVRELTSRMYAPILNALRSGNDPMGVLNAIQSSPWAAGHYGGNLAREYNPNYYQTLAGGRIAT